MYGLYLDPDSNKQVVKKEKIYIYVYNTNLILNDIRELLLIVLGRIMVLWLCFLRDNPGLYRDTCQNIHRWKKFWKLLQNKRGRKEKLEVIWVKDWPWGYNCVHWVTGRWGFIISFFLILLMFEIFHNKHFLKKISGLMHIHILN